MSDIKVLALDLDGTLTNDQKLVTPRTRAALDAAPAKRWWKKRWTLPLCPSCALLPPHRILLS